MGKMKRNHWVPQSYLRAFAADPDRTKIWRFGKTEGRPELKPIEKVAVRFHLYTPKDASGARDYSFEQKLSGLEQWFGHPLWKALATDFVQLSDPSVRRMVSLLTAVMFLRNPANFERTKEIHRHITAMYEGLPTMPEKILYEGRSYDFDGSNWPSYRNASEEDKRRMWIDGIKGAAWMAEELMAMRWCVVVSEEPVFITTDHPVTITHSSLTFRGIRNPDTMIAFPLSPTRLLAMDHHHQEPPDQYYPVRDTAASVNYTLWRNANEFMFSHRDPDLVLREINDFANRMEAIRKA